MAFGLGSRTPLLPSDPRDTQDKLQGLVPPVHLSFVRTPVPASLFPEVRFRTPCTGNNPHSQVEFHASTKCCGLSPSPVLLLYL